MLVVAFLVVGALSTHNAQAADITTLGSGNWSDTAVGLPWPGGTVPAITDNVIIAAGHIVTVTASTTVANLTINAATSKLVIASGQTLTVTGTFTNNGTGANGVLGPGTILFAGTASIAGAFTSTTFPNVTIGKVDGSSTNTVTITGITNGAPTMVDLTISAGATLTNTTFAAGINGNLAVAASGTLTAGSGVYTLGGTGKTITGTMTIPSLAISGTVTNNGILTVTTALTGATLTNGATGTLKITQTGAPSATIDASTFPGNTVEYNGASQTCKNITYANLIFSGSTAMVCPITSAVNLTVNGASSLLGQLLLVLP